jgi:hypothetical protein
MQGRGRLTLALMVESPAALALKSPVVTLAMVAESLAPMLWQLTTAWKSLSGLVPRSAAGTGGLVGQHQAPHLNDQMAVPLE